MSNFIKRHNVVNRVAEEWLNKDFKFTVYDVKMSSAETTHEHMAQSGNSNL